MPCAIHTTVTHYDGKVACNVLKLNMHFTADEMTAISPEWDEVSHCRWHSADGKVVVKVYSEFDETALSPEIKGAPLRIINVDTMFFIETKQDGEIYWYMCCSQSKDCGFLIPVGKYRTFNEIVSAL